MLVYFLLLLINRSTISKKCNFLEWKQEGEWRLSKELNNSYCNENVFQRQEDDCWEFFPSQCQLSLVTTSQFLNAAAKSKLYDIVFIGTSRTRTIFYDTCLILGKNEDEVNAEKAHHNLECLKPGGHNINLHFHWLDCTLDSRNNAKLHKYENTLANLDNFLNETLLFRDCSESEHEDPGRRRSRTAVLFTTGMCEMDRTNSEEFRTHVPSFIAQVLQKTCFNCNNNNNNYLHLLKTEEAVLRNHRLYPLLKQANDIVKDIAMNLTSLLTVTDTSTCNGHVEVQVPILDSFTPSQDWNHADALHLYKLNHPYIGNAASQLISREILSYFYNVLMNEKRII